ncbi:MAG: DUF814 domain-containing protein [Labilithrix sp.]|nr:DUF814 domain-containing protein [Labilithrix sp.]
MADAFVQEADVAERVAVLKVRVPGRTSFVVVGASRSAPGASGAGLLSQGARQEMWGGRLPPGCERQRAREDALRGATIVALGPLEVFFDQHGDARALRVQGGRVVVTDAKALDLPRFADASDDERAALEARGLALARALAEDAVEIHRAEIVRVLERATARIDRRRAAIGEDLAKIAQADRLASQAQWLVAEAARAPRGATRLVVTDWSSGEAVPMEVPLDPAKGAREQVEAMFKRAKRLRLGGKVAEERLRQAEAQQEAVAAALARVRGAGSLGDIDAAAREAKRSAPRDVALTAGGAAQPARAKPKTRVPFRTFIARSGRKILVGKGAKDNDALTLDVARPHDLWLHAKDHAGAHVVVPLDKGQTCAGDDLVDAAHLAAHFSEARDEKGVDVSYVPKRYVRKPKGSAPGLVAIEREKVLPLRFDPALLRTLLDREET